MDENGVLIDEVVTYVPKEFVKSLLWNNNLVVTAYHAVKKRVQGSE